MSVWSRRCKGRLIHVDFEEGLEEVKMAIET